jgi:hypothetical protein
VPAGCFTRRLDPKRETCRLTAKLEAPATRSAA